MEKKTSRLSLAAVLLLGALFGIHRLVDPDVFQQIAVGREILREPRRLGISTFHDLYPGYAYVEDKWLSSVVVALVDRVGGLNGLAVLQVLLDAGVAAGWFLLFRAGGGSPASAVSASTICLAACAFRLELRPDTWSHLLLALLLCVLLRAHRLRSALLGVAVVLGLWVNIHGYFAVGLLVLGLVPVAAWAGDRGLGAWSGTEGASRLSRAQRGLALLAVGCFGSLAHPQGWRATVWPLEQLRMLRDEPVLRQAIVEFTPSSNLLEGMGPVHWGAIVIGGVAAIALDATRRRGGPAVRLGTGLVLALPFLLHPPPGMTGWPYRITAGLLFLATLEVPPSLRERRVFSVLLLGVSLALSVPILRNLSFVPPAAVLLLVPAWARAARSHSRRGIRSRGAPAEWAIAGLVLALVGWARVSDRLAPGIYRAPGWVGWGVVGAGLPIGAADFVHARRTGGRILNDFHSGGYLLARLHPARRVFVAGNTSMYPASFLGFYREEVMGGATDLDALSRRYGIDTVILAHAAMETPSLTSRLAHSPGWRLAHLDEDAAVWARASALPEDRLHLEEAVERITARTSSSSPLPRWLFPRRRVFPALNVGIFLRAAGRPDLALREADRLWNEGPATELATFAAAAAEEAGVLPTEVSRLSAATARDRRSPILRSWLARALFFRADGLLRQGEEARARLDLDRSHSLAPDEPGPLYALARLAAARGDLVQARELLDRALALSPDPGLAERAARDPLLAPLRH